LKTLSATLSSLLVMAILVSGSSVLLASHAVTSTGSLAATSPQYQQPSSQQLSLGVQAVILNAGNQTWKLTGGTLLGAQFGSVVVASGNLNYHMKASVSGLSASGSFSMSLTNGETLTGQTAQVSASGSIVGFIPSICFPNYDQPSATGTCESSDTSAVPAFFEAAVAMSETIGSTTTSAQELLLIEAPIMNPWGAPLVISSADGTVSVMATYTSASADWNSVQLVGTLSGTFNGQPASGSLYQVAYATENFVTGTETEMGTVAFQGMTPSSLNAQGAYIGSSTVPTTGSYDCSALAGLPEGTCTETGLTSTGTFLMWGSSSISGSYAVSWPAPSVYCWGTITATVNSQY
jgi:hypothetical protein